MKSTIRTTTFNGITFNFYGDIIARATFAVNVETGECKVIRTSGYITNDLTARKAIAVAFDLATFRK